MNLHAPSLVCHFCASMASNRVGSTEATPWGHTSSSREVCGTCKGCDSQQQRLRKLCEHSVRQILIQAELDPSPAKAHSKARSRDRNSKLAKSACKLFHCSMSESQTGTEP
jgi:hypothetical protein